MCSGTTTQKREKGGKTILTNIYLYSNENVLEAKENAKQEKLLEVSLSREQNETKKTGF